MGKPGRPGPDLDDYLDWQERLENFKASKLTIKEYCIEEGVSASAFHRWKNLLRKGIPKSIGKEIVDVGETSFSSFIRKNRRSRSSYPMGA